MNRKMKIFIILFLAVMSSITAVYAVTIIASKDVIYDNSKSGGLSSNVQGAIDELYGLAGSGEGSGGTTSSSRNIVKYITNLAEKDTTNLAYDDTSDKNLRYIGSNPNNYVEFNGELWRIIGVMNNVEDANGKKASRVKIIRDESIGNLAWDENSKYKWESSTLQNLLNKGDYYNKINDYSNKGLTQEAKNQIDNIVWNLGGMAYNNSYFPNASKFYVAERSNTAISGYPIKWTGYVGLMYPSDYGYSMGGDTREKCVGTNYYQSGNSGGLSSTNCPETSWIFNKQNQWTITVRTNGTPSAFFIGFDGRGDNNDYGYKDVGVRPTVYLNLNVRISTGSGTDSDPYKLTNNISFDPSNAAPPKIDDEEKLKPVKLSDDGTVTYVSQDDEEWYNYNNKKWANAVILVDTPSTAYKVGDTIKEADIESYFVWIPKYKYKLWNTGTAIKNKHEIEIIFDTKDTVDKEGESCKTPMTSGGTGNCNNGEWMTHPAFISLGVDGFWVGKFETGYKGATSTAAAQVNSSDSSKIIIKPNVYSWRNNTVYNMFVSSYNYERTLDSHMMKNTEWGAVAYLSHSKYGINTEVNINNNSSYKTGYSALPSTNQQTFSGVFGDGASYNQAYNTNVGYLASTTGNISGVYDMSGGCYEYVSAHINEKLGSSGFSTTTLANYNSMYFDVYNASSSVNSYQYRILGDATGEMGPFKDYADGDKTERWHGSWYGNLALFPQSTMPWFMRSGRFELAVLAGTFYFERYSGDSLETFGSRITLTG
ncbi:MAG: hypothetical protein OSJ70_08920 [Bacilli bacterium]|nr:hypothetical protein [Bacilli bacterium]